MSSWGCEVLEAVREVEHICKPIQPPSDEDQFRLSCFAALMELNVNRACIQKGKEHENMIMCNHWQTCGSYFASCSHHPFGLPSRVISSNGWRAWWWWWKLPRKPQELQDASQAEKAGDGAVILKPRLCAIEWLLQERSHFVFKFLNDYIHKCWVQLCLIAGMRCKKLL